MASRLLGTIYGRITLEQQQRATAQCPWFSEANTTCA